MDFEYIGPVQLLAVGFDKDADYQGLILDELDRLSAHGLIRVIDLQFVRKDETGSLLALEMTGLMPEQTAQYGHIVSRLLSLDNDDSEVTDAVILRAEKSFGITPDDIVAIAADLEPGEAFGVLLFEHVWAARLKQAIRITGGYPIAQGLLTPELLIMLGRELEAIVEAEMTIEIAEAIKGAAILDALITVDAAEQVKMVAAAEALQALIVSGLIEQAATQDALQALMVAGLIQEAALQSAEQAVALEQAQWAEASQTIDAAIDSEQN